MNRTAQFRDERPLKRSSGRVALVLLGTAGVITAAAAIDAWLRSRERNDPVAAPRPAPVPITATQTYSTDDYIPGVGYYHAPYHGWYPYPYNYHDPARGYFAGGLWQALPWVLAMQRSQPSEAAVASALAARRAQEQAEEQMRQAQSSSSGFRSSGYTSNFRGTGGSGTFSSPRSTPSASPSKSGSGSSSGSHSIQRGGFGSSGGHSSGGSS